MNEQYVDPAVSRTKFERELAEYRSLEAEYRRRGWLLVRGEYPDVMVVLAAPKVQPAPVVVGVAFDFSNYDAAPPSVRLVNPFTAEAYRMKDLPTSLNKSLPPQKVPVPAGVPGMPAGQGEITLTPMQPYMQANSPEDIPFLCIAGVREYHEHPAHSGDVWELHRVQGAGRLVRILEVIYRYGVEPIAGWSVELVPKISLGFGPAPQ